MLKYSDQLLDARHFNEDARNVNLPPSTSELIPKLPGKDVGLALADGRPAFKQPDTLARRLKLETQMGSDSMNAFLLNYYRVGAALLPKPNPDKEPPGGEVGTITNEKLQETADKLKQPLNNKEKEDFQYLVYKAWVENNMSQERLAQVLKERNITMFELIHMIAQVRNGPGTPTEKAAFLQSLVGFTLAMDKGGTNIGNLKQNIQTAKATLFGGVGVYHGFQARSMAPIWNAVDNVLIGNVGTTLATNIVGGVLDTVALGVTPESVDKQFEIMNPKPRTMLTAPYMDMTIGIDDKIYYVTVIVTKTILDTAKAIEENNKQHGAMMFELEILYWNYGERAPHYMNAADASLYNMYLLRLSEAINGKFKMSEEEVKDTYRKMDELRGKYLTTGDEPEQTTKPSEPARPTFATAESIQPVKIPADTSLPHSRYFTYGQTPANIPDWAKNELEEAHKRLRHFESLKNTDNYRNPVMKAWLEEHTERARDNIGSIERHFFDKQDYTRPYREKTWWETTKGLFGFGKNKKGGKKAKGAGKKKLTSIPKKKLKSLIRHLT